MPFNSYSSTYISRTWVMSSGYSVRFFKASGNENGFPFVDQYRFAFPGCDGEFSLQAHVDYK